MQGRSSELTAAEIKEATGTAAEQRCQESSAPVTATQGCRVPPRGFRQIHHHLRPPSLFILLVTSAALARRISEMDVFSDVRSSPRCIQFHRSLISTHPSQDVQKHMLGKEWLAKVDNETSTPYLLVCSVPLAVQTPAEL